MALLYSGSPPSGSFGHVDTGLAVNGEREAVDYDGDGLPDLVSTSGISVSVRRNMTTPGGNVSFASTATLVYQGNDGDTFLRPRPGSPQSMDLNGDGRADFLIQSYNFDVQTKITTYYANAIISNGFSQMASATQIQTLTGDLLYPGDINGDGCTDLIGPQFYYITDCAGHFSGATQTGAPSGVTKYFLADWDGDGQSDLIFADPTHSNNLYLARSAGGGFATPVPLGISSTTHQSFFTFDKNSDGQPEIGFLDTSDNINFTASYYPHNGANAPPDLVNQVSDGFGMTFNPTYVPISQSSIYAKGSQAVFPDQDFDGPMYVVNQFSASDGTGSLYTTTFGYAGARLNLQGRGFEGFANTSALDSRNGLYHNSAYSQSFPTIGAVVEDDVVQSIGSTNPISQTTNVYLVTQPNSSAPLNGYPATMNCVPSCIPSYFSYLHSTVIKKYEVGGAKDGAYVALVNSQYTYDGGGTLVNTTSSTTDEDAGPTNASPFSGKSWTTVIANTIYNNNAANVWCLGRPTTTTTTKTADGQPSLTRTVNHTMDSSTGGLYGTAYGNCRATAEIVEPTTALQVTTNFLFDACGNTKSVSVIGLDETGVTMPSRTTTTNYNVSGSRCQFPESVTNAYSQTSQVAYRYDLGLKSSATDANGVAVSWQYDNFGRKTQELRPDGTITTWGYTDCVDVSCWGTPDGRFLTTETLYNASGVAYRTHNIYADGMNRIRGETGNRVLGAWNIQITTYDQLGRKVDMLLPYSTSSNGKHSYAYDAGNRPLTDTLYDGSNVQVRQINMAYLGQTTTIQDPRLNVITKITDVSGKLRQVTDPPEGIHGAGAGTTKYTYDSFGNLIGIDDASTPSVKSTFTYNIRGFKIGSADADTGTWAFQPDSLNELKVQKDARIQHGTNTTTFAYDLLGRMVSRVEPESSTATSWVYGTSAAAHEIGQLHSVSKPDGYAELYSYDVFGRPQTKQIAEDGTTYQFDYAYNTYGALATLTYPVSVNSTRSQLNYNYDAWGFLNSVQGAGAPSPFWTLTGANDSSAPTAEVLGNGVSIYTGYTPSTSEMISRTEGTGTTNNSLQDLGYTWDKNGNLLERKDNKQHLTEDFVLDNLNRLSSVTLTTPTQTNVQTLAVTYDQAGNIKSKSDVGTYTYGDPNHPHAVTQAGSVAIGYDENGNMNSRAGNGISSYSYNLPSQIANGSSTSQFNYDSNHQRWKQVAYYQGTGTTETIHYIGGLFQVVTHTGNAPTPTEYRHIVPTGSGSAVYVRRVDGTTSTYYSTSDHLGSADLVLDSAGGLVVQESFSPFGARRGANWQGMPSSGDYGNFQAATRQGFTGHEMLDSVNLVHMNGRVYDPNIGRFLSADSIMTNLAATQSVNPYSYAWDNPLRYIDASGQGFLDSLFEVVAVVAAAVLAYYTFGAASAFFGTGFWGTVAAGAVSGFVGGFVGAALLTGNLSAALTAGVTGAIGGGLFAGVGFYADQAKYGWDIGEKMLAHAAVGCAQGALSSGNCGSSAIAASMTEAASIGNLIKPAALGSFGSFKGTVEAGLLGGVAARITGGKFVDGFSVSAAGYLYNSAGPQSPDSKRASMVSLAMGQRDDPAYRYDLGLGEPGYLCNLFVYNMGESAGIDMPTSNGVPIKAYQWALGIPAVRDAGFVQVSDPQPGDIIAAYVPGVGAHVGIVAAAGLTISAAYIPGQLDGVTLNNWGFRGDLTSAIATYWRYTGAPPPILGK